MLPRLLGTSAAVVAVATVAVVADDAIASTQTDIGGDHAAAAAPSSQPEPGAGPVPMTLPPLLDDESVCPGLEFDAELIPPYFETSISPIPEPGPYEICPLLEHAAEVAAGTG